MAILIGQVNVAVAQQNGEPLPPPPGYAQPVAPSYGNNPFNANNGNKNYGPYPSMRRYGQYSPQAMPNNYRPNNGFPNGFRPNNFRPGNFQTPNFGPANFNAPRFNSNDYPMPWNRSNNNGTPFMSTKNLPMMNSKDWAKKVPDWGEKNGPYRNGPWATKQNQERMEGWWDDMVNAPYDMGRMPGGWRAPSVSFPNPVDVSNQLGRQFDKLPGQVREMDVSN